MHAGQAIANLSTRLHSHRTDLLVLTTPKVGEGDVFVDHEHRSNNGPVEEKKDLKPLTQGEVRKEPTDGLVIYTTIVHHFRD